MIDLLGYWSTVTIVTALLLLPFLFITSFIVWHFVHTVTGDRSMAEKSRDFFWDNMNGNRDSSRLFKVRIHDAWVILSLFASFILWIPVLGRSFHESLPLYESVSYGSQIIAPYTGNVALLIFVYFGFIFLARKSFATYKKLEKVIEKVNESSR